MLTSNDIRIYYSYYFVIVGLYIAVTNNFEIDVSADGTEIYEVAECDRTEDWIDEDSDLDILRLVFV